MNLNKTTVHFFDIKHLKSDNSAILLSFPPTESIHAPTTQP